MVTPKAMQRIDTVSNLGIKKKDQIHKDGNTINKSPDNVCLVTVKYPDNDDAPVKYTGTDVDESVKIPNVPFESVSKYPLEQLQTFIKSLDCDWVTIEMTSDYPMKISGHIEEVEVSMLLAPRIESKQ